ncbi:MAG: DUF5103 domain-containing protein, partial [Polaribacter sp.]
NFDSKFIRNKSLNVVKIEMKDIFHHYLYPYNYSPNKKYKYNPDINGQFLIRTLEAEDSKTEADYAMMHFSLIVDEPFSNKDVYVYGAFNNYKIEQENKMTYSFKSKSYQGEILLKQGFYNYTFATRNGNNKINLHDINGSYSETENEYKVIVYHKAFGENYYKAIGLGTKTINPQK